MAGVYGIPKWCPIVPLPETRGKLIDADALCLKGEIADAFQRGSADLYDLTVLIEDAPTIIPADGAFGDGTLSLRLRAFPTGTGDAGEQCDAKLVL